MASMGLCRLDVLSLLTVHVFIVSTSLPSDDLSVLFETPWCVELVFIALFGPVCALLVCIRCGVGGIRAYVR